MTINQATVDLVKHFEGLKLKAYLCPANKWTIGYGSTFYEDGTKVKRGDVISMARAESLFHHTLEMFGGQVAAYLLLNVRPNQFGALVSLAFNIGIENFRTSTILKRVNKNPNDSNIRYQFSRWNKSKGEIIDGLIRRRKAEADLYFKLE